LGLRLIIGKMKKKNKKNEGPFTFFSSSSFYVVGQVSIGKMSIFSLLLLLFSMDGGKKMKIPEKSVDDEEKEKGKKKSLSRFPRVLSF
jgi:hypothetical protein